MWRAEPAWWLLVGSDRVAMGPQDLARAAAGPGVVDLLLDEQTAAGQALQNLAATLQQLGDVVAAGGIRPGADLHVLVSDRWLATATLPWSAELLQPQTGWASARDALLATGAVMSADDIVRMADTPHRALRSVVAYPGTLMAALKALADQCGVHLASVQPLAMTVASGQHRGRDDGAPLAVVEGRMATLLQPAAGSWLLVGAPVTAGGMGTMAQALASAWHRAKLRQPPLAANRQLTVIDLRTPGSAEDWSGEADLRPLSALGDGKVREPVAWSAVAQASTCRLRALDAVGRARSAGPGSWLALVAAGLLAASAVLGLWASERQLVTLRQALALRSAPAETPRPAVRTRDDELRDSAVNAAITQLNVPMTALLAALPPPRDIRVALVGAEVMAGSGRTLKLTAEALTAADMTRYVAFLSDRKPLVQAYLVNHELVETGSAKALRFTVEALWRD